MGAGTDKAIDVAGIAALHRAGEPSFADDTAGKCVTGTNTSCALRLYGNQGKETLGKHRQPA